MTKNLIALCRNKLAGTDEILPILMEVKSLYPKVNITFVFLNKGHLKLIKDNYNIWEAIQSMNPSIYVIKGRNKFETLIRVIIFIIKFSFRDNIIVKNTDMLPLHNIVMKVFKKLSKTKEVKTYLVSRSLDAYKIFHIRQMLTRERRGVPTKTKIFKGNYDYFLSTLNSGQFKEFFDAEAPEHKMVKIGYIRKLPQWQKHIREAIRKNRLINDSAYFLYILSLTSAGRRLECFDEPEVIELLEESLNILKKYNIRIKTIFKPHAFTDIKEFKHLLNKINYSNYAIDYGHPFVLTSKAKFVFGNFHSSTMFDAYYLGKPIVEYRQYDLELFIRMGKQSGGGSCCDFFIHRDQKKLDEVLDRLINSDVNIIRDPKFIENNFPDTPQEFYEFWHKLL